MAGEALHNVSLYNSLCAQIEAKRAVKFNHSSAKRLKTNVLRANVQFVVHLFIS